MTEEKLDMFVILKDINLKKSCKLHKHPEFNKLYNDFMINRFFSMTAECVFEADMMNKHYDLPKHLKYLFLSNAIEKKDRFLKYIKPDQDKDKDETDLVKWIQKIHHVNKDHAQMIVKTISDDEKKLLKQIFTQKTIRKR